MAESSWARIAAWAPSPSFERLKLVRIHLFFPRRMIVKAADAKRSTFAVL
jgi:hypothetical protein